MTDLQQIAQDLVAPGKGILAADESTGTIKKRFDSIGVTSTEETRRKYRELLFTAPGLGEFISGTILYDETIRQSAADAETFVGVMEKAGITPGIKVDTGAKPLAAFPGETVTEGLDGLRERLADYRDLGARFAKWRATILIGDGLPTLEAIKANGHAMARYAALCQEAGIVPIVEPEILMDGSHDMAACESATTQTLQVLFLELAQARVDPTGLLLKVNMIVPGSKAAVQESDDRVAEATVRCLAANVPAEVPGVVFLSGGMSDELATSRLNRMNQLDGFPWQLSFSYGRALQAPALSAWGGLPANVPAAQAALLHRAKMNSLARRGIYDPEMERRA